MKAIDLSGALLTLYYVTLGILAFYGIHRLALVAGYLRSRKRRPAPPPPPAEWPQVTVQLPLYNEMYVATRLLDAVCAFDYPRDRLEIQVLDDSTDETTRLMAERVEQLKLQGFDVQLLHRGDRAGFKAGALAAGLLRAKGDLIAVFDADFVPDPDFLRRTVPYFGDPAIGMVQGSWSHLNRDYSLLTRIQAILLDGHFQIEHTARNRNGCFFNFNGTAGIWRRAAIEQGGGWQHDTLTEDLDLSYRSQLAGWKFLYLPELAVPSELPVDVNGFKSQQFRWAKGSVQTGRKLLGRILRAPLPWRVKFEAFVHLTNNGSYPLTVLLSVLIFPAMVLRRGSSLEVLLLVDAPLFLGATLSVLVFYLTSQQAAGRGWLGSLKHLPAVMALGIGLSINNARAVLAARQRGGVFDRTPKYRIEQRGQEWRGKRYRASANPSALLEALFALYFLGCFLYSFHARMWASLPFLYLFLQGYTYIFLLSVRWKHVAPSAGSMGEPEPVGPIG